MSASYPELFERPRDASSLRPYDRLAEHHHEWWLLLADRLLTIDTAVLIAET